MLGENIENLKNRLSSIKEWLAELKEDASKSIETKEKEAKELLEKAKEAEKQLEEEIRKVNEALKKDAKSVDDKIKKAKEEAESFLKDNVLSEIQDIHDSIKTSLTNWTRSTSPKVSPENQNIFSKTGNWIKEQRDKTTIENFEKNPWDTLLRGVGFALTWVWGLALAVKWIRKLWKWALKDDKDKKAETKKKKEKKSFWESWFWKILKWTMIGSAITAWIFFLTWGKIVVENEDKKDEDDDKAKTGDKN